MLKISARLVALVVLTVVSLAVPGAGAATPAAAPKAKPPAIKHVFVINLENKNYDETFGANSPAPYLSQTLTSKGLLLEQYFGIGHVSLDNYIAQISGQGPSKQTQLDCTTYTEFVSTGTGDLGQALGDGCVYPTSVKTIADQLTAKKLTWKGYMEDMATPCQHPVLGSGDPNLVATAAGAYATRHNPFVYFHSIIDSPICKTNVVSLDGLPTDLKSVKTTPNLTYITPGLCNDGHDAKCPDGSPGGLVAANTWLQQWVPKVLASPAFKKDGLLIVTFDEAEAVGDNADATTCCNTPAYPNVTAASVIKEGPGGGRVGAVLVSPFIKAGTTSTTPYNHFALLCSLENLFGLQYLGYAAQPGLQCFGKDVYNKASG
jgi:phosphatidylinositol-3-phosphatase